MPKRPPVFTTKPDTPPPVLRCPSCDQWLKYQQTVWNGTQPLERWDLFECATCGMFEYRHRTRKVRPVNPV